MRDTAILEAQMLHRLSSIMAEERQLYALALSHPDIDAAYFSDFRLALLNCTNEFSRVYGPHQTILEREAAMEAMSA